MDDQTKYSYTLAITGAELKDLRELLAKHGVDNVPDLLKIALANLRDNPPKPARPAQSDK